MKFQGSILLLLSSLTSVLGQTRADAYDAKAERYLSPGEKWMEIGFFIIYQNFWSTISATYDGFKDPGTFNFILSRILNLKTNICLYCSCVFEFAQSARKFFHQRRVSISSHKERRSDVVIGGQDELFFPGKILQPERHGLQFAVLCGYSGYFDSEAKSHCLHGRRAGRI